MNRMPVDEHVDQEEEKVCHHCQSEQIELRERMTACATRSMPAEYEAWYFCHECGEESDYDDV